MNDIQKNPYLIEEKKVADAVLSDCRIKILRNLSNRRMTAAELTHKIGVQKNAIYKHLDKLLDAQIVRRIEDDERKWVYYELTEKGSAIVSSKRVQIFVIISSGIGTLSLGMFLMARYFSNLAEISGRGEKKGEELLSGFDMALIFIIISVVLFGIAFFISKAKWKNIDET
ncbi:Helix-turn-helix domain protein [uncultured archaeon]|nr:Helix-turn-helix domain protein [uncultured archaeon]